MIENDANLAITDEMVKKAEADLAMVSRQTAIQGGFQAKSDFFDLFRPIFVDFRLKTQKANVHTGAYYY